MSEKHETAGTAMYQAIPRLAGDIASGRAENPILFHKHVALCATCLSKRRNPPACRRRIGPFIQVNTWFGTDRVNRVNYMHYTIMKS
jgi:hypothetical protein